MTAGVVASIVGNPISASILEYLHGAGGLDGWQWVFFLEGMPAVLLGVITLYYLTDRPEVATWLTPDKRDWLVREMAGEEQRRHQQHGLTLLRSLGGLARLAAHRRLLYRGDGR